MTDTLLDHRSIRKYKADPIPNTILDYILEAGTRTSTKTRSKRSFYPVTSTSP